MPPPSLSRISKTILEIYMDAEGKVSLGMRTLDPDIAHRGENVHPYLPGSPLRPLAVNLQHDLLQQLAYRWKQAYTMTAYPGLCPIQRWILTPCTGQYGILMGGIIDVRLMRLASRKVVDRDFLSSNIA